jgi:hypothetical protein
MYLKVLKTKKTKKFLSFIMYRMKGFFRSPLVKVTDLD